MMSLAFAALEGLETSTIYTPSKNPVINETFVDGEGNPLRKGIEGAVNTEGDNKQWVPGIRKPNKIENFDEAKNNTMSVVKKFINYALGLLSFVALVYLIAHGVMVLTAMDDDAKVKKWTQGIKTAAIALGGIGVSWLLVSFIFYIIKIITQWGL